MSVPFFYEPQINSGATTFELSEASSRHCIQVLRMRTGAILNLTNGMGLKFEASILSEDRKAAVVQILSTEAIPAPKRAISIGIALLKNSDRFEWMLEKITEIGVSQIYPLNSKRSEQHRFRFDRYQQIIVAAMLQSQQCWLPILHEPMAATKLMQSANQSLKLIAHCEDDQKNPLQQVSTAQNSLILIGPEGDFSREEIELALQNNFIPVSLGETRLRTETAGVVAITLLANPASPLS
ncbi:MAG: rRNA methyltransferase [Chitinophagaceae bacterium BSSC1]|nr:MAG: rRNA methyltransferase [Chitinophagaceae bacterium BSSC1]